MRFAWVFPGQGSQFVGMGKELYDESPAAKAVFERVNDALGQKFTDVIFGGPEQTLTLTENAQPAILAMSIAVLEATKEALPGLPAPAFAAGHSLGEYSAHVAAGSCGLEETVKLVRARGRAMQNAVPAGTGAMAAILGLPHEEVQAICLEAANGEPLQCANYNAPGQTVIAGTVAAVDRAKASLAGKRGKAIQLKVSAPFHCGLMDPAAREIDEELKKIRFRKPRFPVIANFTGAPVYNAEDIHALLVSQVSGAVQWQKCVEKMGTAGVTHVIEFGPGKVLTGLVRRIVKPMKILAIGNKKGIAVLPNYFEGESATVLEKIVG